MLQKNPLHSIGMHWASLHGLHSITSGCMDSTALYLAAWNPLHSMTLHGIHCIQSGCILPGCMESTAFNHAAWNPLHSIRMHFNKLHGIHSVITLHGLRCIQSGSITPQCMESSAFNRDAFYQAAWNPCIHHTAWTPLHIIGIHCATMHGILCIQ